MSKRSRARGTASRRAVGATIGDTVVRSGGAAAGTAARRAGAALHRAGSAVEQSSATAAPVAAEALGAAVEAVESALGTVGGAVGGVGEVVGGFLEEPALRGSAALDALVGRRVTPPVAGRRWTWALAAAGLGAAAGAGAALLARRLQPADPPGAQEPHELEAVVDRPGEPLGPPGR